SSSARVRFFATLMTTPPRSRGAFFAPGVLPFASLPRSEGEGSAERRSGACEAPVGHAVTRRARRLRGALRPMTRDARLSALHRGGFGPRGRASVSLGARRPTTAGRWPPAPCDGAPPRPSQWPAGGGPGLPAPA